MKKILCIILTVFMLVSLVSCKDADGVTDTEQTESIGTQANTDTETETEKTEVKDLTPITYPLNHYTLGVKVLGVRSLESDSQINCDWTCSGIEMNIEHNGGNITFSVGASAGCYFRAYVDGEIFKSPNTYYNVPKGRTILTLKNVPEGTHTLRLVKVTGYTLCRAEIYSVSFAGKILDNSPAANELYIEYIGDSISCGWGVIGAHDATYTAQDGTLAYPYLVSEALGADYSITALSGQGLLVGNPGIPKGYLYGSALRDDTTKYTFSRKADIVVINIGTNDYSQKRDSVSEFKAAYAALLETVREKNGDDCKIICIYNTMNDTFSEVLKELCEGKESSGIYLIKFDKTSSGHPTTSENKAYTTVLTNFIKNNILGS